MDRFLQSDTAAGYVVNPFVFVAFASATAAEGAFFEFSVFHF